MIATNPNKSPFKFLDPFGKDDISFFFGRESEIDKLYQSDCPAQEKQALFNVGWQIALMLQTGFHFL